MAFMGGMRRKVTSREFEGGEVTAIMGGCGIDLREASILDTEATIEVFVWAGSIRDIRTGRLVHYQQSRADHGRVRGCNETFG